MHFKHQFLKCFVKVNGLLQSVDQRKFLTVSQREELQQWRPQLCLLDLV